MRHSLFNINLTFHHQSLTINRQSLWCQREPPPQRIKGCPAGHRVFYVSFSFIQIVSFYILILFFDSWFRHRLRRNRQEIKYAVDFVNTGSTNMLIINHKPLIINVLLFFSSFFIQTLLLQHRDKLMLVLTLQTIHYCPL